MTYAIPMQPRGFRRLRRIVWTIRAFMAFRRRLNGGLLPFSSRRWPWSSLWGMAQASAQAEADDNNAHGWAWSTPAEAVQNELECWTE